MVHVQSMWNAQYQIDAAVAEDNLSGAQAFGGWMITMHICIVRPCPLSQK